MLNLRAATLCTLAAITLNCAPLDAQTYPSRPVRIVTSGVGGGNDIVARVLAQGLTQRLGQNVIVDNRSSGVEPGDVVARTGPEGYTLLVGSGGLWQRPSIQPVPTDILRDFATVSLLARAPLILVVHPSIQANSVKELIALAKAKPGALNYSTGSTGSASHLSPEVFKYMAGVNMVRIPYKSGAQEITDLLGGQVQLAFGTAASVMTHVKSGKLRALAVTTLKPSPLVPGIPAISETLPGYEMGSVYGLLAPVKTSVAVIKRLNEETARVIAMPETKERLLSIGVEAVSSSPQEFAALINSDVARIRTVIKSAGIKAD